MAETSAVNSAAAPAPAAPAAAREMHSIPAKTVASMRAIVGGRGRETAVQSVRLAARW